MSKAQLILALDLESFEEARTLIDDLGDSIEIFKVGSQMFTAMGPFITRYLQSKGKKVFLDLKFHDIPNTVASAVKSAVSLSISPNNDPGFAPLFMLTVHTVGGKEMLEAAAQAAALQAKALGVARPLIVGVTVLTSTAKDANLETVVLERACLAKAAGLDGVVASVEEAAMIRRELGPDFLIVTPGIRPADASLNDQKRVATPAVAIQQGSNFLVVGRPIIQAPNRRTAALNILEEYEESLMNLFIKKPISQLIEASEGGEYQLKRSLGALNLVSLGIGAIIGAGLFSLTGIAAAENAGPAVVLSFIVAAIGCTFAGMCYSELASMIPVAGSAYTYAYATMGEFFAWIIGWDLVLEYAVASAVVAVSWSRYVGSFLQDIGVHFPARLAACPYDIVTMPDGSQMHGLVNIPAMLIIVLISLLLMLGIKESATVNDVIVVIKLAVVVTFIAVGIHYIKPGNYVPFIPPNTGTFGEFGFSGIMRAAGIIFFAYIGFDTVSTAAQEAHNPQRDIPRGIIGSLIICTIIYILFSSVLTGMLNYKLMKGDAAPVATAINLTPYPWLHVLIKLGIIGGFTSVILVMLLGQSRIFYAMSRDGLLPKLFSDIHPKWRTPWRSNLLFMVFTGFFAGFFPISKLGNMTSIGTLLAFIIVCAGVMILRYTQPDIPRAYRCPYFPQFPILGILVCLAMMTSLDSETWWRLLIWLLIGLIIYFTYSRFNSKLNRKE